MNILNGFFINKNIADLTTNQMNTSYLERISLSNLKSDTIITLTGILIGDVNDSYSN